MVCIDKLRADFLDTGAMMVNCGELTIEQWREVGSGIADAVNAGETGELRFWCDWFAIRGEAARGLRLVDKEVRDYLRMEA